MSPRELESCEHTHTHARRDGVRADRSPRRWVTRGITCNLVTAGAPVTLNRSLITVPARIGSLAALSRATACKLISAVLGLRARCTSGPPGVGRELRLLRVRGCSANKNPSIIPKRMLVGIRAKTGGGYDSGNFTRARQSSIATIPFNGEKYCYK